MGKRERSVRILNEEYLVESKPQENLEYKKKLVSRNVLNDIVLTEKQKDLLQEIEANDIVLISGPAGSSKTWSACYYAVLCLKTNKFDKIIFTKPIREAGEQLGFLPGDIKDKIDPHYESFRQNMLQMIDKQTLLKNYERGVFEDKPLAYLRGAGFNNCLSPETKVKTDIGETTLEELFKNIVFEQQEINILSHNKETGLDEYKKINGIQRARNTKKMIKFTLENGEVIFCTEDHIFFDDNYNKKEAKDFNIDDNFWLKK